MAAEIQLTSTPGPQLDENSSQTPQIKTPSADKRTSFEKTLKYLPYSYILPTGRFVEYPHIVDMKDGFKYDVTDLRVVDGITTLLYYYDLSVMRDFLNLKIPAVGYNRKEHDDLVCDLLISRDGSMVSCGLYNDAIIGGKMKRDWDSFCRYRVQRNGEWTPMSGFGLLTMYEESYDPHEIDYIGMKIAQTMLVGKKWEPGYGVGITQSKKAKPVAPEPTGSRKPVVRPVSSRPVSGKARRTL